MKFIKSNFAAIFILIALVSLQACKPKKLIQKPEAQPVTEKPAPPVVQSQPKPVVIIKPAPAPKPVYDFRNIQFEFNSAVLKTEAYPILDKAASEMKMDPSVKFSLSGYASVEGTAEHNMILSQDRASSVKTYLINTGVSADNLTATGYGTSNPIADNNTEEGKVLNRRVEIHKQN
jgi:OOP family OmpA-OmpF porin